MIFTDPSCYHATLGTLLLDLAPDCDLASALGNTAATRAVAGEHGPVFGDVTPDLAACLRSRGYRLTEEALGEEGAWERAVDALRVGRSIVVLADTFYLEYYWMDYGRVHSPHTVVLRDFDPESFSVCLLDPVDASFHNGRLPLAAIEPALLAQYRGQSWLSLERTGPGGDGVGPREELIRHATTLAGSGAIELSGFELASGIRTDLDEYFALASRLARPDARDGDDDDRRRITRLIRGLWTYHHTLRWFARYLHSLARENGMARLRSTAEAVEQISQHWLVVRSLLMRGGVSGEERSRRYREEAGTRLDRVLRALRTSQVELSAAAGETACPTR